MSDFNAVTWSAAELLADIYRQSRLPSAGTDEYTPEVVLGMATTAIHNWAGTIVGQARDGRCLATIDRAYSDTTSEDGQEFAMPPMALGDTLDSVSWIDSSSCEFPLEFIPQAMEHLFAGTDTGRPSCYAFRDGGIRVFPRPDSTGTLRIKYMRRHGALVIGSDTAIVESVASVSSTEIDITVSAIPASVVVGSWVDVIGKYYPYRIKLHGLRVTAAAAGVITVELPIGEFFADIGDTLVIYGKTPVVSLPLELKEPLTLLISSKLCEEIGDPQLAQQYAVRAQGGGVNALNTFAPRAKSDRQKLVNRYSIARGAGRRRTWVGEP